MSSANDLITQARQIIHKFVPAERKFTLNAVIKSTFSDNYVQNGGLGPNGTQLGNAAIGLPARMEPIVDYVGALPPGTSPQLQYTQPSGPGPLTVPIEWGVEITCETAASIYSDLDNNGQVNDWVLMQHNFEIYPINLDNISTTELGQRFFDEYRFRIRPISPPNGDVTKVTGDIPIQNRLAPFIQGADPTHNMKDPWDSSNSLNDGLVSLLYIDCLQNHLLSYSAL
jgi:hypothetical protein